MESTRVAPFPSADGIGDSPVVHGQSIFLSVAEQYPDCHAPCRWHGGCFRVLALTTQLLHRFTCIILYMNIQFHG